METFLTEEKFWAGIVILIRNYHAINKNIFGCITEKVIKVNKGIKYFREEDDYQFNLETLNHGENVVHETTEAHMESVLLQMGKDVSFSNGCEGFLIFFKFLTKKIGPNIDAVGKIDMVNKTYLCKFHSDSLDGFSVQFDNGELLAHAINVILDKRKGWIDFMLKPKLIKWCTNPSVNALNCAEAPIQRQSLQLVNLENYNELYKRLKTKYAEKAFNFWSSAKESTNPMKFIHEDLAIAAYLICLWERFGIPKGFADLGCGNGLLVYLLAEEGYNGYGYDVRARKIWSHYPPSIRLLEKTIEPYTFMLPEDVDWLIGNHSDELSPWIPVLAAKGGYKMRYFLLPCCAYELSGAKFQRRNTKASVYQDFYTYLKIISQNCFFTTLDDRLKIPSTKRLALIGIERTYSLKNHEKNVEDLDLFLNEQIKHGKCSSIGLVKLRDKNELVRNCTKINNNILDALVLQIFYQFLAESDTDRDCAVWRTGIRLRMCDIVKNLKRADLQNIKAECGGIKTLLRNKHEIFEFMGNDFVCIRKPSVHPEKSKNKVQTVKKRACFFYMHHPDGCPLTAEQCTFIH